MELGNVCQRHIAQFINSNKFNTFLNDVGAKMGSVYSECCAKLISGLHTGTSAELARVQPEANLLLPFN